MSASTDAARIVAESLETVFTSPNESDRNFEAANVVDGLFAIARGLHAVAKAIEKTCATDERDVVSNEKRDPHPLEVDYHTFPLEGTAYELDHCTECGVHIKERHRPCTVVRTKSTPRS